jgi:hypothetical protein
MSNDVILEELYTMINKKMNSEDISITTSLPNGFKDYLKTVDAGNNKEKAEWKIALNKLFVKKKKKKTN